MTGAMGQPGPTGGTGASGQTGATGVQGNFQLSPKVLHSNVPVLSCTIQIAL